VKRLVLAALVAAAVLPALAGAAESPRVGSFDLIAGPYRPDLDAGLPSRPFSTVFGRSRPWLFRFGLSYDVTHYFGSLEVGLQTGYLTKSGFAKTDTGAASSDETALRIIPTSATLTYRFDYLADRFNVPLAPYGRVAFERYNWWTTNANGGTAKYGATNGWSAALGLALMLDFFDPTLSRELDMETGINHTYVFAEARKTKVDDFGSSKSWDLSDDGKFAYALGILFVF
jgi:hypothetical protein